MVHGSVQEAKIVANRHGELAVQVSSQLRRVAVLATGVLHGDGQARGDIDDAPAVTTRHGSRVGVNARVDGLRRVAAVRREAVVLRLEHVGETTAQGEVLRRTGSELHFRALQGHLTGVRQAEARTREDVFLEVLQVLLEHSHVQARGVVEQLGLQAQFDVGGNFRLELVDARDGRVGGQVEATCLEAARPAGVNVGVFRGVVSDDEVAGEVILRAVTREARHRGGRVELQRRQAEERVHRRVGLVGIREGTGTGLNGRVVSRILGRSGRLNGRRIGGRVRQAEGRLEVARESRLVGLRENDITTEGDHVDGRERVEDIDQRLHVLAFLRVTQAGGHRQLVVHVEIELAKGRGALRVVGVVFTTQTLAGAEERTGRRTRQLFHQRDGTTRGRSRASETVGEGAQLRAVRRAVVMAQLVVVEEATHLPIELILASRRQADFLGEGLVALRDDAVASEVERGEVRVEVLVFIVLAESRDGGEVEAGILVVHLYRQTLRFRLGIDRVIDGDFAGERVRREQRTAQRRNDDGGHRRVERERCRAALFVNLRQVRDEANGGVVGELRQQLATHRVTVAVVQVAAIADVRDDAIALVPVAI